MGPEEVRHLRQGDLQDLLERNLLESVVVPPGVQVREMQCVLPHLRDGQLPCPQVTSEGQNVPAGPNGLKLPIRLL